MRSFFHSSNPVLKAKRTEAEGEVSCTYFGVGTKTLILFLVAVATALVSGLHFYRSGITTGGYLALGISAIVSLVACIVATLSHRLAGIFSVIYAIGEGVLLGFTSMATGVAIGGNVVFMALLGTFGVLFAAIILYFSGAVRVTSAFRKIGMLALIGILFSGLISLVLLIFAPAFFAGLPAWWFLLANVISVIVSSMMIFMDLDDISRAVDGGAPAKYEWRLAVGLMVSVVWLYVELLELFARIFGNRD